MLSKSELKHLRSLKQAKFRQMYDIFVAEGDKLVSDLILKGTFEIEAIYCLENWFTEKSNLLNDYSSIVFKVTNSEMEEISLLSTPSSVYILLKRTNDEVNAKLIQLGSSFLVDGVQDPGNLGTIIRIADWFGFKAVIRTRDSADFFNPKTIQSSMGSICNIHLCTIDRNEISNLPPSLPLVGVDVSGVSVHLAATPEKAIYVLGSEGRGISAEIKASIQSFISIPGSKSKFAESLNVAVSSGIIAQWVSVNPNK